MLKKCYFILCLFFCISLLAPLSLHAEDMHFFENVSLDAAIAGETLYMMTHTGGLHAYQVGKQTPEEMIVPLDMYEHYSNGSTMLVGGDALWILDAAGGWMGRYADGIIAETVILDESQWNRGTAAENSYRWPILTDEALYTVATPAEGFSSQGIILRFDRAQGITRAITGQGVYEMVVYKAGELLVRRDQSTPGTDALYELAVLDGKSGALIEKLADLPGMNDGHIAYDAQADCIYAVVGDMISRLEGRYWAPCRYIPLPPIHVFLSGMLPDGHYVAVCDNGVYIRDVWGEHESITPLNVVGIFSLDESQVGFSALHPNTPVSKTTLPHLCAEEMAVALQAGDDSVDVYLVRMHAGLKELMRKGFLADLTGAPDLVDDIVGMYTPIRDAVFSEDKLYAVPVNFRMEAWATPPGVLESLDIALPPNLAALLDMEANGQGSEDMPLIAWGLSGTPWGRDDYTRFAFDQYVMAYGQGDSSPSFDTPAFRAVMARIAELPFTEEEAPLAQRMPASRESSGSALLNTGIYVALDGYQAATTNTIAFPGFSQGQAPHLDATLEVLVLNPHSKHKETALAYLTYVTQNRSTTAQYLLRPDLNEPVLTISAQQAMDENQATLAELDDQLHKATKEVDQRALERDRDEVLANQERLLAAPSSWAVYEPALKAYRKNAPYMDLRLFPVLEGYHSGLRQEMLTLLGRTLDGQLTLDECIAQMDMRMQRMFDEQVMDRR